MTESLSVVIPRPIDTASLSEADRLRTGIDVSVATQASSLHEQRNDDSYSLDPIGVYDGLSGYAGSNQASQIATAEVTARFRNTTDQELAEMPFAGNTTEPGRREVMAQALLNATQSIKTAAQETGVAMMDTTATIIKIIRVREGDTIKRKGLVASMGDGSIKILENGQLRALNTRHTGLYPFAEKAGTVDSLIKRQTRLDRAVDISELDESDVMILNDKQGLGKRMGEVAVTVGQMAGQSVEEYFPYIFEVDLPDNAVLLLSSDGTDGIPDPDKEAKLAQIGELGTKGVATALIEEIPLAAKKYPFRRDIKSDNDDATVAVVHLMPVTVPDHIHDADTAPLPAAAQEIVPEAQIVQNVEGFVSDPVAQDEPALTDEALPGAPIHTESWTINGLTLKPGDVVMTRSKKPYPVVRVDTEAGYVIVNKDGREVNVRIDDWFVDANSQSQANPIDSKVTPQSKPETIIGLLNELDSELFAQTGIPRAQLEALILAAHKEYFLGSSRMVLDRLPATIRGRVEAAFIAQKNKDSLPDQAAN